jgi:hypothetical protein
MRISQRLKIAERELSPADKNTVIAIANRLGSMGDSVKSAQAAFTKWRYGEKYTPQKDNLKYALKQLYQSAKATLSFVDKLP